MFFLAHDHQDPFTVHFNQGAALLDFTSSGAVPQDLKMEQPVHLEVAAWNPSSFWF
jgi:hypothetical protein